MACHVFWVVQCPSNLPSFNEWDLPACYEKVCSNFFYDILIYSTDWDNHIKHLEIVLSTLIDHKLYAKL